MSKRYLVPQYIDMEDKLVGPMTLIQFLYVLAGGVICYGLLASVLTKIITIPLAIIFGSFFLALAFFRYNDQSFPKMFLAFILFHIRPQQRVWKKTARSHQGAQEIEHQTIMEKYTQPEARDEAKSHLAKVANLVDTHGWDKYAELNDRVKSHHQIKPSHLEDHKNI